MKVTLFAGLLVAATQAFAGCPVSEFRDKVDYDGSVEVAWSLATLLSEEEFKKNSIQTNGAFNYFEILSAKGQGNGSQERSRSYLKTLNADYFEARRERILMSSLSETGLKYYKECLQKDAPGFYASIPQLKNTTYSFEWAWTPQGTQSTKLRLFGTKDTPPEVKEYLQRYKLAKATSASDSPYLLAERKLAGNVKGRYNSPLTEVAYDIELLLDDAPAQVLHFPGRNDIAIRYFANERQTRVCNDAVAAAPQMEASAKAVYAANRDFRRIVLLSASSTTASKDDYVRTHSSLAYSISGKSQISCDSAENEKHKSATATTSCQITLERGETAEIVSTARAQKGVLTEVCVEARD